MENSHQTVFAQVQESEKFSDDFDEVVGEQYPLYESCFGRIVQGYIDSDGDLRIDYTTKDGGKDYLLFMSGSMEFSIVEVSTQ